MQKIMIIRHGETDYNLQNRVQGGGIDSSLNDTGRKQAALFAKKHLSFAPDAVYCTSLQRTRQTLQPFADAGHQIIEIPELNEMNWGILEGMEESEFLRKEFKRVNAEWKSGNLHETVENGESPVSVWERSRVGLDKIFETNPAGNLLICTHGRLLRVVLSSLLGYGLANMNLFQHENTGANLLVRKPSGKLFALTLNDITHLNG